MSAFYISAAHKSSGKTSVSIGLAAAMSKRGLNVQTFKRGPDYIDPIWLAAASTKPCYNLDFNTQTNKEIETMFAERSLGADVSLVEGNKGLYDGVAVDGSDSNAALVKLLNLPTILVVDCEGMTRGIAPLLLGYKEFDSGVNIAGVILNKTGGSRHEGKLRAAMEEYTDIPVLGALAKNPEMEIPERHLGLMPANEMTGANEVINRLSAAVEQAVDIDAILSLGADVKTNVVKHDIPTPDITIAVAKDAAFGFYYADDLETFEANGAKIVFFDTMKDAEMPKCDGLFIGGGFPETKMKDLSKNESMRASIKAELEGGLPCYAECGGLMYLSQNISFQGQSAGMVGFIPASIKMHEKPQGRGLVELLATGDKPWGWSGKQIFAHEFHYAELEDLKGDVSFAYSVERGFGVDGKHDGIILGNCLASFSHLRHTQQTPWVNAFTDFVRSNKV